jgi:hypothetical protein
MFQTQDFAAGYSSGLKNRYYSQNLHVIKVGSEISFEKLELAPKTGILVHLLSCV